jgi:hypothetical protein
MPAKNPKPNPKPDRDSIDIRGIETRSGFDFTDEKYRSRVATAAYYKAERRGFAQGGEMDDWLSAEREINAKVSRDEKSQ